MHVGAARDLRRRPVPRRLRPVPARRGPTRSSASRLHLIPRFRKRLMTVPIEQGRPIWVDDDRFDISYHVRLTALPRPGSRDQLLTLTASHPGAAARPVTPALGALVRRRAGGRPVALDPEDPPRAGRRRVRRRRRDGAARLHTGADRASTPPRGCRRPLRARPSSSVDTWVRAIDPADGDGAVGSRTRRAPRSGRRPGPRQVGGRALAVSSTAHSLAPRTSINVPVGRRRRFDGVQVLARRREGDPRRARGHRQRRRARRGVRRAPAPPVRAGRRRPDVRCGRSARSRCATRASTCSSATGSRRCSSSCRSASPTPCVRLRRDRRGRPRTSRSGSRPPAPAFLIDLTEYAAPSVLGLAARLDAPAAVLQPHRHERPRPAGAAVLPRRADAGGVPDGPAVGEPEPRRRDPLVLRACSTSASTPTVTRWPDLDGARRRTSPPRSPSCSRPRTRPTVPRSPIEKGAVG